MSAFAHRIDAARGGANLPIDVCGAITRTTGVRGRSGSGLPHAAILGRVPTDDPVSDAVAVVLAFNEAINNRDVAALAELMTPTHRFTDSVGATTDGKAACAAAWRGFFDSFPDYRNIFDEIADNGDGVVVLRGHSECSFTALDGPATWRAVVLGRRVDVWHVVEPAPDAR